jgi:acyl-CoA thioester hydrolase
MTRVAYEHEIEVRFRDCDAMGHVNNAVYLTYLEQARIGAWARMAGSLALPLPMILARAECDYTAPLTLGDRVLVRLGVSAVGRTSFTLEYELLNARTRQVVATARTVQVMYDYEAGKPVPISDELRARLTA